MELWGRYPVGPDIVVTGSVQSLSPHGHQLILLVGGPRLGLVQIDHRALEVWHDVACQQFVAVKDLLSGSPLGGLEQESSESAALIV